MRKPAEITVFLSLILVSILSLLMGLLESARTAGARMYLQMSADSALASVMSQYNRNLWEMYDLLFLEYEREESIEKSFEEFFQYYLEQENLYPMKLADAKVGELTVMTDEGGAPLEEEILAYVRYRLPDVAKDLAGITGEAAKAAKAGDFGTLLEVCRQAGKETRKLEKKRAAVEEELEEMRKLREKLQSAADRENAGSFRSNGQKLMGKIENFSAVVDSYEKEIEKVSSHRGELSEAAEKGWSMDFVDQASMDSEAEENLEQELSAYGQVEEAAREALKKYREMERTLRESGENLEYALEVLAAGEEEDSKDSEDSDGSDGAEETELDWEEICMYAEAVEIPASESRPPVDREKAAALDRLEELLEKDMLDFVLPEGAVVSDRKVNGGLTPEGGAETGENPLDRLLMGEYVLLYFDSFLMQGEGGVSSEEKPLSYEQEYILCGKKSDRENLKGTVERLLAIRGASNLSYLLSSPEKKGEAELLAAAVSGGAAPVQFVLSFLILTLWAFGEAVLDVRTLLAGETVPLWKSEGIWRTSLEGLLGLEFLEDGQTAAGSEGTSDYSAYMRILLFLQNRLERNFRLMDLIQWNMQKQQADFSVRDCAYEAEMKIQVKERHLFLLKSEYDGFVTAVGGY